mgnify:CR=1 FL=1
MTSDKSVLLKADCMECGHRDQIAVDSFKHFTFRAGVFVQDVWPELSKELREIILGATSGMYLCNGCWGKLDEDGG